MGRGAKNGAAGNKGRQQDRENENTEKYWKRKKGEYGIRGKRQGAKHRFFNRRGEKPAVQAPLLIGIAGSSQGVGATHFAIMTASYLSGVLRKRTALLERNPSGDFARIESVLSGKPVLKETGNTFTILEISFIKEAGAEKLSALVNSDFDAVVVDFGNKFEAVRTEFLLCQRKFLVGSLVEWKAESFLSLAEGRRKPDGKWEYFTASGSRELETELRRYPGIVVRRIPRTEDAFSVTGEVMDFFGEFLEY